MYLVSNKKINRIILYSNIFFSYQVSTTNGMEKTNHIGKILIEKITVPNLKKKHLKQISKLKSYLTNSICYELHYRNLKKKDQKSMEY